MSKKPQTGTEVAPDRPTIPPAALELLKDGVLLAEASSYLSGLGRMRSQAKRAHEANKALRRLAARLLEDAGVIINDVYPETQGPSSIGPSSTGE